MVLASDDDDDGIDDEFEDVNKRDIEIEFEEDKFEVQTTLRSEDIRDNIKFSVDYDSDGVSIELEYISEFEENEQNSVELEFSISLRKLIEYVDMDGNRVYEDSVDQKIQEVEIKDFKPLQYSQLNVSPDTALHYFILETTDGIFTAHLYFAEEFTNINSNLITPSQSKIDIEIDNFSYLHGSSQLALYIKLESEVEYEEKEETEDEKLGFATNESSAFILNLNRIGFFSWKENALIDGIEGQVSISPIEIDDDDEFEQKLFVNYPRAQHIYHDPKIGIEGILLTLPRPPFPIDLTTIIVIVIVAFSIGIAYSGYHYRATIFPSIFLANEREKELQKSRKRNSLFENNEIEERLENPQLTALSADFFEQVNRFDWKENEKEVFIKEMLALNPFERNLILNEMIKKV
jgi:hypothetical protein